MIIFKVKVEIEVKIKIEVKEWNWERLGKQDWEDWEKKIDKTRLKLLPHRSTN